MNRAVEIHEVRIPIAAVKRLSAEDRYSYYLLGHMFNELMALQKLVGFALPKHDDQRHARLRPELAQAMFLFRLSSSKIWEASLAMTSKELSRTLQSLILPKLKNGTKRLKALNAAVSSAPWLSDLRNGLGFHFPAFSQWKSFTTPDEDWVDDLIFMGERSGNVFYDAADSVAQHWMFRQYGSVDVKSAVDPLVNEMISLLKTFNSFLEDVLHVFVVDVLGATLHRTVGKVLAPAHQRVSIPFWTSMDPASVRNGDTET